jgi:hypothetical protein
MVTVVVQGENGRVLEIVLFDPMAVPVVGEIIEWPVFISPQGHLRKVGEGGELFLNKKGREGNLTFWLAGTRTPFFRRFRRLRRFLSGKSGKSADSWPF